MTGAGSGTVAIAMEDAFLTLPDVPTWFKPGEALEDGDATLDRQLTRIPQSNDPRGNAATEGNRRGTFSLSFTYAGTEWHDLVFPADTPLGLAQTGQLAPTATIYEEVVTPSGTEQRFLAGAGVESFAINYSEGENVTVDLNFTYFDEPEVGGTHGDAPAQGDISTPSKEDIVTGSGFDMDIDGGQVENLQSATVEVGGMVAPRTQQAQIPTDLVVGNYEQSASVSAYIGGNDLTQRTYGSDTAVEPLEQVDETTATVTAESRAGDTDTYTLTRVQPATTNWQAVTSADEQATNPTDLQFVDITVA